MEAHTRKEVYTFPNGYSVFVVDGKRYEVVNVHTGVTEFKAKSLLRVLDFIYRTSLAVPMFVSRINNPESDTTELAAAVARNTVANDKTVN